MPIITILFGLLLVALGLEGYTNQLGLFKVESINSLTALIPAGFGALLSSCGLFALMPSMRKTFMHIAATIGLVGALAGLGMGLKSLPGLIQGTAERPSAVKMQLTMGVISLVFLGICVRSFMEARRRRKAAGL